MPLGKVYEIKALTRGARSLIDDDGAEDMQNVASAFALLRRVEDLADEISRETDMVILSRSPVRVLATA